MIIDDSIPEGNEYFLVWLRSIDPFAYTGNSSAKIVIAETEPLPAVREATIAPMSKLLFT